MRPRPNVPLRTSELPFEEWREGERFGGAELPVSRMAGAAQVHVNVTVVAAGRQSCPYHFHMREEEHFYVLSGKCMLRAGASTYEVQTGDYVCFPAGTGVGHCFSNPFDEDCTILCIGPNDRGEIAVYPDSGKAKLRATQTIIEWPQRSLDYWQGEKVDTRLEDPHADDDESTD